MKQGTRQDSFYMAGVLVHAFPHQSSAVAAGIAALPGAAVHAQSADGKLVVTLEGSESGAILEQLSAVQRLPGVMSAVLVSEHTEPLETIDEDIADAQ